MSAKLAFVLVPTDDERVLAVDEILAGNQSNAHQCEPALKWAGFYLDDKLTDVNVL